MQTEIAPLNQFFAERVLKENVSEEHSFFLSTLMQISREGHLCWKTEEVPSLPSLVMEDADDFIDEQSLTAPVIKQQNRYYLHKNWVYETHVLQQVKRLLSSQPPIQDEARFYEELKQADLLPLQKKAVERAFQKSFSLICGGPGTGKTYTASFIVKLLLASKKKERYRVVLAAPTGKAASHLQTVMGNQIEATTLHRLLKIIPGENHLFSNQFIDADLLIVDEASMMDVPLLAQLLESIGPETRLVLMGDPDQLPPVEAGSLFAEMADLFGVRLTECKRTNLIHLQELAREINRGEWSAGNSFCLDWTFDDSLRGKLFEAINPVLSWQQPDPNLCLDSLNQFRILGALRQGPFGIDELNQQIVQEMGRRIKPGQWWAIPIMISNNEPRLDLYNGTCGILVGKSRGGIHLRDGTAYFPQEVSFRNLPSFEVAFCLSIHKSQGSEFEKILALFPQGSENFGREAIYTAVTRAKKEVEVVADEKILQAMLSRTSRRGSGFTERFCCQKIAPKDSL